jgi:hypothetical protein
MSSEGLPGRPTFFYATSGSDQRVWQPAVSSLAEIYITSEVSHVGIFGGRAAPGRHVFHEFDSQQTSVLDVTSHGLKHVSDILPYLPVKDALRYLEEVHTHHFKLEEVNMAAVAYDLSGGRMDSIRPGFCGSLVLELGMVAISRMSIEWAPDQHAPVLSVWREEEGVRSRGFECTPAIHELPHPLELMRWLPLLHLARLRRVPLLQRLSAPYKGRVHRLMPLTYRPPTLLYRLLALAARYPGPGPTRSEFTRPTQSLGIRSHPGTPATIGISVSLIFDGHPETFYLPLELWKDPRERATTCHCSVDNLVWHKLSGLGCLPVDPQYRWRACPPLNRAG